VCGEERKRGQPDVVAPALEPLQSPDVACEHLIGELLLRQPQPLANAPHVGRDVLGEGFPVGPGHDPPGIEVPGNILRYSNTDIVEAASKEPE
jgi:hypothetical protein